MITCANELDAIQMRTWSFYSITGLDWFLKNSGLERRHPSSRSWSITKTIVVLCLLTRQLFTCGEVSTSHKKLSLFLPQENDCIRPRSSTELYDMIWSHNSYSTFTKKVMRSINWYFPCVTVTWRISRFHEQWNGLKRHLGHSGWVEWDQIAM